MIMYFILWADIALMSLGIITQIKSYFDAKEQIYLNKYGLHQNHLR